MEKLIYEIKPYALITFGIIALKHTIDNTGTVWAAMLISLATMIVYQRVKYRSAHRK